MEKKTIGLGTKCVYMAQFVFTIIGLVLQAIITVGAFTSTNDKLGSGLALNIASNVYALLMFVLLFIYAFYHFNKEDKFFYGIAILNAAFATAQVVSAQVFMMEKRPALMALLAIHMGLLVAFITLINVDSEKALSMMKWAFIARLAYYICSFFIYVFNYRLDNAMTLISENATVWQQILLIAKNLMPLLIDTSVYLCYRAKLRYKK